MKKNPYKIIIKIQKFKNQKLIYKKRVFIPQKLESMKVESQYLFKK